MQLCSAAHAACRARFVRHAHRSVGLSRHQHSGRPGSAQLARAGAEPGVTRTMLVVADTMTKIRMAQHHGRVYSGDSTPLS